jgi:nucleotide-binding universal stress UspA family protein
MRTYLVVMDATAESATALRYAARRAARTGGTVEILAIVERQEFVQWGGVQAAMEEEARLRTEARVAAASGEIIEDAGIRPSITIRQGPAVQAAAEYLKERREISALVLAAAPNGAPGPLIAHFSGGAPLAALPCPLIIVPGGLDPAALDRLTA